jgi:glycosyltransferase involved in cell wall biosynthesis
VNLKPKARLAVCGIATAAAEKRFKEKIRHENLESNVTYFGYLDYDSLIGLIKSSCLLVYPSHTDAFSLVVLEALACGTPVIAYSIDAVRTIHARSGAVLQVQEGDVKEMAAQVLKVLEDQSLRRKLSLLAINFVENYDWDAVVEAEKKAYFTIIEN